MFLNSPKMMYYTEAYEMSLDNYFSLIIYFLIMLSLPREVLLIAVIR